MRGGPGLSVRLRHVKRVARPGGGVAFYHRAPGGALTRLPDLPTDDPGFLAAWAAAERALGAPAPTRPGPRSLAALVERYLRSRAWRDLAASTRADRRRIALRIADKAGAVAARAIEPRHIRADLDALTPAMARNRLKVWRALMRMAVEDGWRADDPAALVRPPARRETPHRAWTRADVAAFRARWPLGSRQRTALELLYWTGCRRSDVVRLGPQHLRDGWLRWPQAKTGGMVELPVACALAEALAVAPLEGLTWLQTDAGAPRTAKGFGQWWAAACRAAGVSVRAHGLRHTFGADAAEAEATEQGIGAALGHRTSAEARTYTQSASRRRLAEDAMERVERERQGGTEHGQRSIAMKK